MDIPLLLIDADQIPGEACAKMLRLIYDPIFLVMSDKSNEESSAESSAEPNEEPNEELNEKRSEESCEDTRRTIYEKILRETGKYMNIEWELVYRPEFYYESYSGPEFEVILISTDTEKTGEVFQMQTFYGSGQTGSLAAFLE
ncbi:MAG: hypothetical protein LUI87_03345 [Lachnospiraceae bacterium]|nr:hypothetical protein [Lachnospiraceae bacterium]